MSLHVLSVSAAWTAAGWTMLHLVWIGAVGGLIIALLRRCLRPVRPELRHGVAVACLLALTSAPAILFARLYRPEPARVSAPAQAPRVDWPHGRTTDQTPPLPAPDLERASIGLDPTASPAPVAARFELLVGYLPGIWLSGSLATLALIATGLVGVERLRRSSRPLGTGGIAEHCRALAASLGVARRVGVAICDRIAAPVLIGVLRPLILLPPAALGGWSIELVEMALLHELAHIRRHDNLITLLQRLAESLLFFHPVTWWLSAWVGLERELCCDRLVVQHTGRPHDYARMLAALAGAGPAARTMALAMAERPLTTRIRRILDMEDRSMKLTLTEGLGLLAAAIVGTAFMLAAHAGPTPPDPQSEARRTLERMAKGILATPDSHDAYEGKGHALIEVAKAQIKLGDRGAARETLRLLDGLAAPRSRSRTRRSTSGPGSDSAP
jgi:beta-lactamase regulating signal transducer with metallopeptidase domain